MSSLKSKIAILFVCLFYFYCCRYETRFNKNVTIYDILAGTILYILAKTNIVSFVCYFMEKIVENKL